MAVGTMRPLRRSVRSSPSMNTVRVMAPPKSGTKSARTADVTPPMADALDNLALELTALWLAVTLLAKIESHRGQRGHVESPIDLLDCLQASDEEARAHQGDERQRHLTRDERVPEREPAAESGNAARLALSSATTSGRDARRAGTIPKTTHVSSDTIAANTSTCAFSARSTPSGPSVGGRYDRNITLIQPGGAGSGDRAASRCDARCGVHPGAARGGTGSDAGVTRRIGVAERRQCRFDNSNGVPRCLLRI